MSNRQSVLLALQKHGKCTYNDLELSTGIARDKLRIAINDAKKAGHVDAAGKDTVSGMPAYEISRHGITWLTKNMPSNTAEAPEENAVSVNVVVDASKAISDFAQAGDLIKELEIQLAEVQKQIDDQHSMLTNQAEQITAWKRAAKEIGVTTADEMRNAFAAQDIRLTDQVRKTNEALERVGQLEDQLQAGSFVSARLESIKPAGYIVARPKKPLRRINKEEVAESIALGAVRAGGSAEVFALVPHGKAVRGAEFRRWAALQLIKHA